MRCLRAVLSVLLVFIMCLPSHAQAPRAASLDSQRYRELAQTLEPAAFVSVRLTSGKKLTGTILSVNGDSFVIQRHSRIPEPARNVRFDDVMSMERSRQGMNPGQKVLIGVGASVAGFLLIMLVAVSAISD